ncbi:hypothetical protein LCM4577_15205 [Mesorhizobium sp. LCM 4577]|uniref:hypothetical protein n=1 Tax=Mesorhizobium sp. LCM 4577 TaxID=1848288 RepID=UPI0008DAFF69|nr:hypothetical protein [Mesorhizobium sp. LCM 4577]OHV61043.1 hypothetical protein LCM4577_15205 [Mesorhizobium sp. LCM 4577]
MSSKKTGKPEGKPVAKTADDKGRQSVKASENKTGTKRTIVAKTKGEFGVVAGTRKEQVAIELKANGREAALKLGEKLGLAKGTITSWVGSWKTKGLWKPVVEAKPAKTTKGIKAIEQAAEAAADVAAKAMTPEDAKRTDQDA